ncbi:hypothetical protein ABIA35_002301 [Catenulispora sp. MAP12-49]|uniref:hypothetical protein n=1 Tax=Catenulispora sp. MAP12-49 TaxID=3156302 RepID=UPI003517E249
MKQQNVPDFDTRPLAEGLRELAGQAADTPGLFDAVAAGARRRSARLRVSGAVLAVGGVLGIAAGVAAWLPASGAGDAISSAAVAPARCPEQAPTGVRSDGPANRLYSGTPAAATLCVYGYSARQSGASVRADQITGSSFKTLIHVLTRARTPGSQMCTAQAVNPEQLLVVQFPDGSSQDLVINLSGCGTVTNGVRTVLLPRELFDLVRY